MTVGERYTYPRPEFDHEFFIEQISGDEMKLRYRRMDLSSWRSHQSSVKDYQQALNSGHIRADESYNVKLIMKKYEL